MKLRNLFTLIALTLGTNSALAEWDAIQCGPTTTPVLTNAGWQCQPANANDPRVVHPNDGQPLERSGPFIASNVYWASPDENCSSCYAPCKSCSSSCSSCYAPCSSCDWPSRNYLYYW